MKKQKIIIALFSIALLFPSCGNHDTWKYIFHGNNLNEWTENVNSTGWVIKEDALTTNQSGLIRYTGSLREHSFKNFILEAEVETDAGADAGIWFHTSPDTGLITDTGYECRISNMPVNGSVRIMTGSLSGIRNLCKSPVGDEEWFTLRIAVEGKTIRTWVNGNLMVDYTEPDHPYRAGMNKGCILGSGTFALVNHREDKAVSFRNIRVKVLPDDAPTPGIPLKDTAYAARLIRMNERGIPLTDLHVHLKEGLTIDKALEHARMYGFTYGIAFNGGLKMYIETDDSLGKFLDAYDKPAQTWLAMQAEGREWMDIFSEKNISRFDYVFTDAMTWTNNKGKRMRLWIPEETEIGNPQDFMDQLVDRIVRIVSNEPINIYVNATYLPDAISPQYDELWTEERMDKVIRALKDHNVAMEISARFKIPSATFIRRAKAAGVKFTFGTNNTGPDDLGRLEYCMDMVDQCGLTADDFWFPDIMQ